MRALSFLFVLFSVTLVAGASGRADGLYFTEQLGVARVGGELGRFFDGGLAGHIGLGVKLGDWAVEGSVDINSLYGDGIFAESDYEATGWGMGVRRIFPVSEHLRLYARDRKSTRLNSSHSQISYAVFCLKKKNKKNKNK